MKLLPLSTGARRSSSGPYLTLSVFRWLLSLYKTRRGRPRELRRATSSGDPSSSGLGVVQHGHWPVYDLLLVSLPAYEVQAPGIPNSEAREAKARLYLTLEQRAKLNRAPF